jgi:YVTN family beta-propeller protein
MIAFAPPRPLLVAVALLSQCLMLPIPGRAPAQAATRLAIGRPAKSGPGLAGPRNVAFARGLPYTVLVTEIGMADMNAMVPGTANAMLAMQKNAGLRTLFGPLLHTGSMPHGVNAIAGTPDVLVSNFGDDPGTAVEVDLRTMHIVHRFTVGLNPTHFVVLPGHRFAFVTNIGSNDVYRLDLATGATRRIAFPNDTCLHPHGDALGPDGYTLYVACAGDAWIASIDTRTLRPGRVGITDTGAYDVKVNRPRQELWVSNQTANDVTVLDLRTLKKRATIALGKGMSPALLVLTPDGRRAYVGDLTGNAVSVIDAVSRRVIATVPVAAQPFGPTVTPDGRYVYEPSIKGSVVTIIRVADNKVMAVVPAPVGALHVALLPRMTVKASSGGMSGM